METTKCACGGLMHHSSEMENPGVGAPFYQCEDCGEIIDDAPTTEQSNAGKATTGPWSVGTSGAADYMGIMTTSSYYVEAAGHEVICELGSCGVSEGSEQRAANARLIAAAPA